MCANPKCWCLVHENPIYGGYCCKKCHWRQTSSSKSKKHHGLNCAQREAPEGAPRAPEVPPNEPLRYSDNAADGVADGDPTAAGAGYVGGGKMDAVGSLTMQQWESHWGQSLPGGGYGPQSGGFLGAEVRVTGFVEHSMFNGLPARVESETGEGRYNLLLADGTRLRWVKQHNFERLLPPDVPLPPPPGPPPGPPPAPAWVGQQP